MLSKDIDTRDVKYIKGWHFTRGWMELLVLKNKKILWKLLVAALFTMGVSTPLTAQWDTNEVLSRVDRHDVGVLGGLASYMGEFNEKNPFYEPSPHFGAFYRFNFNRYIAARAQVDWGAVKGDSKEYKGGLLGFPNGYILSFDRNSLTLDLMIEFNFLPFSPTDKRKRHWFSPYLAVGAGANYLSKNKLDNNPALQNAAAIYPELYGDFAPQTLLEIPMGMGIKVSPVKRFTISVEWLFKKTFYDQIDGFTNKGKNSSFNLFDDDWVTTINVGVSYRLSTSKICKAYEKVFKPKRSLKGNSDSAYGSKKSKSGKRKKPLNKINSSNY